MIYKNCYFNKITLYKMKFMNLLKILTVGMFNKNFDLKDAVEMVKKYAH